MTIGEHGYIYVICLVELKRWIGVACGGGRSCTTAPNLLALLLEVSRRKGMCCHGFYSASGLKKPAKNTLCKKDEVIKHLSSSLVPYSSISAICVWLIQSFF